MRKSQMKRIIAASLAGCLAFSLSACGGTDGGETTTKKEQTSKKEEETKPQVDKNLQANSVMSYDQEGASYSVKIDAGVEVHDISDMLLGLFIEDINFAADGGLYAEKIVNRSFEFTNYATDNELYGWSKVGNSTLEVKVDDKENCLNENNTNYLIIGNTSGQPSGVQNKGFLDGLSIEEGAEYNFSFYAKGLDGFMGPVTVQLTSDGEVAGSVSIDLVSGAWTKYEAVIKSSVTSYKNVKLQLLIDDGSIAVDMVSLFPVDTYKGRENGMRKDLAEMLEDLNPTFLRFPGGCVIEGYDANTAYDWKDSIGVGQDGEPLLFNGTYGDVAAREQGTNIWTNINTNNDPWPSFMTYGLGFYEYFVLAEDLGAIGVPVVNCGLYCQVRGGKPVQIGSEVFEQYIQDALDLVEFCRGDETTTWGKVRVSLGHPEPFELKYIGIGNENWGRDYYTRYEKFRDAFEEAAKENPELFEGVEIMYSAGVDDGTSGPDYMPAYTNAKSWLDAHPGASILDYAGAIDHHYYNDPEWFFANADYYDEENYSRDAENMLKATYGGAIPVFVGEYAARSNTLKAALAEAAYLTGIERNSDIIRMAAYAPLFGNLTATHWSPDMIWFNNHLCTGSINYYVQKNFANNVGTKLLQSELTTETVESIQLAGKVGVGTWNTSAEFDNVKVVDNETGEVLGTQDFESDTFSKEWYKAADGNFSIKDGKLVQSSLATKDSATGSSAYFGSPKWSNYTYTVEATKTGGSEGFLIPFAVGSSADQYFWNIGGWNNTVTCVQQVVGGVKGDQMPGTVCNFSVQTGKTYEIKVVVSGNEVTGYIDGVQKLHFKVEETPTAFQVVSTDETGDIIVKIVNVNSYNTPFAIDLQNAGELQSKATVYQVKGETLGDDNILGAKEDCIMEEFELDGITSQFNFVAPKYSVTVLRIHH